MANLPPGVCLPNDLSCDVGVAVSGTVLNGFQMIATEAGQFASEMLARAATWWVNTPSVNPDSDAVRIAQSYTVPLIALILMASILAQSIRIVVQRKFTPLLDAGVGLVRYAVTTGMGLLLLGAAVQASDALAQWMLADSIQQFTQAMGRSFTLANQTGPTTGISNAFGLLVLALIALLLAAIQWVLGFLRQAGVLVLAAMLPLAASGAASQTGKTWLPRLVSWLAALIAYKPMAALIYVIGFSLLGNAGDMTTAITGIMVLVLATIALPALMRFFNWAVPSGSGGGGVAGALGAFAGSRLAAGGGGGGAPSGAAQRDSSVQQAGRMDATGPRPQHGGSPSGAQQGTSPSQSGRLPGRARGEADPQQSGGTQGAGGAGKVMPKGAAWGVGAAVAGTQAAASGMQGGGPGDDQQRGQQ